MIKQSSNVVVNLTTGGSPYMPVDERVRPAAMWKAEVASLRLGSMKSVSRCLVRARTYGRAEARVHLKRYLTERPSGRVVEALVGVADDKVIIFAFAPRPRSPRPGAVHYFGARRNRRPEGRVRRLRAEEVYVRGMRLTCEARTFEPADHNQCCVVTVWPCHARARGHPEPPPQSP